MLNLACSCFPILFSNCEFYLPGRILPHVSAVLKITILLFFSFFLAPCPLHLLSPTPSLRFPKPTDPAYSGAHILDSSSPHFSLTQVLFILHWSFIWALTRDLLCKAASSRFFLCPWHLLKILSASQVSNHSLLPASLLHNISLIFLLPVFILSLNTVEPYDESDSAGLWGFRRPWPGPWPWSALGLPQWVANAIAHRNNWI